MRRDVAAACDAFNSQQCRDASRDASHVQCPLSEAERRRAEVGRGKRAATPPLPTEGRGPPKQPRRARAAWAGGFAAISLLAFAGLACYTALVVWGQGQQGAAARVEASCARGDPLYPAVRRPGRVPPFSASGDQSARRRLLWQG
jgi:hypothetical protein